MMGYNSMYCGNLKQKSMSVQNVLPRRSDLINELVDPICVISNANEILITRLGKFVDDDTRTYFEMITRAVSKTKMLVNELRNEKSPLK